MHISGKKTQENGFYFLKDQNDPVYKSDIVKEIGVDYDSLNLALDMLNVEIYKDGRVKLIC